VATLAAFEGEGLASLTDSFSGVLLQPGDDGYEEARKVHNGAIDKRPALIARCRLTADIVDALAYARDRGLEVSVRGGGHNVAGTAVTDGGVMLDLSLMKGIHVDPKNATVRAQGGVIWREFNRETHLYGFASTGGFISTTGIAGLTLGGGMGWLMPKYGFAVDNLLSVEVVTASGEVLTASEEENTDLYWALRGGGGNFGVAASLEYRLHPLSTIYGGLIAHPLSGAKDVLRFYRDFTGARIADELMVASGLVHAPDGSGTKLVAFVVCHCGPPDQAEKDLKPLVDFGNPAMVQVGPMPYPIMNTLLDAGYPKGALNYWKSSFFSDLADEAIDVLVERFGVCPSPMDAVVLEHHHGAGTRVPVEETPLQHRMEGHNCLITAVWMDPALTEKEIAWARETNDALRPHLAPRRWLNYQGADDIEDAVREGYGPNYDRLSQLKRKYDPDNLFRLNLNIPPAAA
jgi:FAD/FMN-containing dehydrogenase